MSKVLKPWTSKYLKGKKDNAKEFRITKDTMQHYPNASRFEGGHQLNEHALRTAVLPLIKKI